MDPRGAAASHYRGGRLVVCCHGSDAVQTTNQKIEDIFRRVQIGNRAAVSPLGREYSTATRLLEPSCCSPEVLGMFQSILREILSEGKSYYNRRENLWRRAVMSRADLRVARGVVRRPSDHFSGAMLPGVSRRFARSQASFSSACRSKAHSTTRPNARGGSCPCNTVKLSIATTTSSPPYTAWKCGGPWSSKYIRMTIP